MILAAAVALLFYFCSDQFLAPPDCAFYWAWSDTLFSSLSLDFSAAYERLQMPAWYVYLTDTGRLSNDWPMGTGLLLLPAAWAGPTWAHTWILTLLTAVLVWWWNSSAATGLAKSFSLIGLVFGTPLLFYGLFAPFFSHIASFVSVSAFLIIWSQPEESNLRRRQLALGLLLGLSTLVRPQNILLAAAFLPDLLPVLKQKAAFKKFSFRFFLLPLIAGLLLGLLPRFPAYAVLYGNPIALPKLEEMQWFSPHLFKTFFNDYHGVLPWTPVYAVGLIGLIYGLKENRRLCTGLLAVFLIQVYVNAANEVWWSGGSFGNRRLTDYSLVIAWGLMFLLSSPGKVLPFTAATAVVACSAWTLTLLLAERRLILPLDRYIPFSSVTFLPSLMSVYQQPGLTWESLTRSLDGNEVPRGLAAGVLFIMLLPVFLLPKIIPERLKKLSFRLLIGGTVALAALIAIAALRTPPVKDPQLKAQLARRSAILWDNYMELAGYHMIKEEYAEAEAAAETGIALRPDAPTAYWYKGVSLLQAGSPRQAVPQFEKVLQLDPSHHNAGQLLAAAKAAASAAETGTPNEKPASQPAADWRVQ